MKHNFPVSFLRILTSEARMMAANTQTGRGWNKGPRDNITTSRHKADTKLVNMLLNRVMMKTLIFVRI